MRAIPEITAEMENFRMEQLYPDRPNIHTIRRDMIEPVPIGSYVAAIFRVTGYGKDCDGSALARIEQVGADGESTGWSETSLGLYPESWVVLDSPGELHAMLPKPQP